MFKNKLKQIEELEIWDKYARLLHGLHTTSVGGFFYPRTFLLRFIGLPTTGGFYGYTRCFDCEEREKRDILLIYYLMKNV